MAMRTAAVCCCTLTGCLCFSCLPPPTQLDAAAAGCRDVHHMGDAHPCGEQAGAHAVLHPVRTPALGPGSSSQQQQCGIVEIPANAHANAPPYLLIPPPPAPQGFNMPAEGMWFWVEGVIDLFFYIDLVLNFFVAYEVRAGGSCGGGGGTTWRSCTRQR